MSLASDAPSIADLGNDDLTWRRRGAFSNVHDLQAGERSIGTLTFSGRFRSQVVAEHAGRRWRFVRHGIGMRSILVVDAANERQVAEFRSGWWRGGMLVFEGGSSYRWRRFGFAGSRYAFLREDGGDPLVMFRTRPSWRGGRGEVTIDADARRLPELPLLVLFGWYVMLKRPQRGS